MWRHVNSGHRQPNKCCIKGAESFTGTTAFQWFHLHDVNTVQTLFMRNRPVLCPCVSACGSEHSTYFRIGVGKGYPKMSILQQGTGGFANQTVTTRDRMDWTPATDLISSSSAGPWWMACFKQGGAVRHKASGAMGEMVMEVFSSSKQENASALCQCLSPVWFDESHPEETSAYNDARSFINCIVANKVTKTSVPGVGAQAKHFRMVDASARRDNLINGDNSINIHPGVLGLARGEVILDAVPVFKKTSCIEALSCMWCCDRQMKANTALVLTNRRLVAISEMNFACAGEQAFETMAFFLGQIRAGFVIKDARMRAIGAVETQYGGLSMDMSVAGGKTCLPCGARKMERRAVNLWTTLAAGAPMTTVPATAIATAVAALPNVGEVQDVAKELPLAAGEAVLGVVRSQNMWNLTEYLANPCLNACACGHYDGIRALVQCFSCCFRPWKLDNFVVLTDRRVFTIGRIGIRPFCGMCCKRSKSVIAWMPLDNMLSAKLESTYSVPTAVGACERFFAKCFPCLNPSFWSLNMELGIDFQYKSHPFLIRRFQALPSQGYVDAPDITHFRRVLGAITAARAASQATTVLTQEAASGAAAPMLVAASGAAAGHRV
jgi:hypothetical protein